MPLNFFYTIMQKKSKMTKNSNQVGPALTFLLIAIDTNGFRRMKSRRADLQNSASDS